MDLQGESKPVTCVQEVDGMWEEVQEELKQKKVRVEELKVKLSLSEAETTQQVRPDW